LFLTTGMRISEVVSLTSEQILNATRIWKVYQLNIIGKGNKLRSIFPPKETLDLCKRIIGKTETILWWKKSRVANLMRRISKETKIKFSAHTLRHTYLSYLARKWADIYKIQKIAGHSSITTTALYLHSANKELAETASLIKGLI
jgi:integrase/recombinase XerD